MRLVPSFNARPTERSVVRAGIGLNMYYVYVLKSKIANFYYKGFCNNLSKRLIEHNSGMTKSNKKYIPFDIVYFEECTDIKEAVEKDKYWKSAAGRRYLKNKLN